MIDKSMKRWETRVNLQLIFLCLQLGMSFNLGKSKLGLSLDQLLFLNAQSIPFFMNINLCQDCIYCIFLVLFNG